MPIQEIESISPQEVRLLIARLERVVSSLRAAEIVLGEASELWVFRKKSMEWGISRLESVVPEIERSILAHRSDQPYGPTTQKGRPPKKAQKKAVVKKKLPAKKRG